MQKLVLLIATFLCFIGAKSQSIALTAYDEFIAVNSANGDYFGHGAIVKNISNNVIEVKITRLVYNICAVDSTHFDWALCCTPPSLNESIASLTIDPGDSISDFKAWCYGSSSGMSCTDSIRYTFYNVDDPNDTASVVFKYVAGPDIGFSEEDFGQFKLFPNPADEWLSLESSKSHHGGFRLSIYNATGVLMIERQLTSLDKKVDVSSLPNGNYVLELTSEQDLVLRQKVVVQH